MPSTGDVTFGTCVCQLVSACLAPSLTMTSTFPNTCDGGSLRSIFLAERPTRLCTSSGFVLNDRPGGRNSFGSVSLSRLNMASLDTPPNGFGGTHDDPVQIQ